MSQYDNSNNLVPGFTMSLRTRPLIINKFREYVGDRSVTIQSKRLVEEMKVFVWKNGRPEAQTGYNDDLVMSFGIAMYLRDTSLKFQQQSLDLTRNALNNITVVRGSQQGAYFNRGNNVPNPYSMGVNGQQEDIRWLF
jgi:hypothetical protein